MTDPDITPTLGLIPAAVRTVVRLLAPSAPARVTGDQELVGDLGYHSLALAELGFTLEDLFALEPITPEQAMSLSSIDDLIELIRGAIHSAQGKPPSVNDLELVCAQYGATWDPEEAATAEDHRPVQRGHPERPCTPS
jgi:acyl carrier protein